jgi:hypothetical protein
MSSIHEKLGSDALAGAAAVASAGATVRDGGEASVALGQVSTAVVTSLPADDLTPAIRACSNLSTGAGL